MPMAAAFGLTVTPWAPLGGGVLTGKYSRGGAPEDSKRAGGNERRLTEGNLRIAREVDAVADELGKSSAQVALAWLRQRSPRIVPIVGARKRSQIEDVIGCLSFRLVDEHLERLDEVSKIDLGFPGRFLGADGVRGVVYGDLRERIDLPPLAQPPR
jgi:aryl-alcohol dehydrogenase-like predicted oxidoreductase